MISITKLCETCSLYKTWPEAIFVTIHVKYIHALQGKHNYAFMDTNNRKRTE